MARHETDSRSNTGGTGISMPFLDDMPALTHSFFEKSAELQSEFLTLWSHRAQAWLNWPKQFLTCKDPGDLMEMQNRFLTTMQRHYRDYFDSVLKDSLIRAEPVQDDSGRTPPDPKSQQDKDQAPVHRKAA